MDGLYDNLENYEDLQNVEKLKAENVELKNKLEEYSIAMDKLQKDFDRVSSDFQTLEMNYSSLLKTAKMEIERKTKIISDLNIEKDTIVLKALQNRNIHGVRDLREITKPFQKGPMNDNNFVKKSANSDNQKVKSDIVRKEDNRLSSVDTVTSCNTDIMGRLLKIASGNTESTDQWSDRTSDTKENMTKKDVQASSSTNTQALSIRNRRKSMPSVRPPANFSSDDDCEDTYCRNETYKKCFPSREDGNRQNVDTMYNDRYRHKGMEDRNKVSESVVDGRYSGYEPNRDTYHRNRTDKYRSRDKYDHRHRRNMSPERPRRPPRAEYQRQEYNRQRYLESPPRDKFHHYQQRNHSKYDRDDQLDFERRDHHQDKYPIKHKANDPFDEPITKRQRTDSFSKYSEEEKRWIREKGVPLEKTVSDLLEEMPEYTSCQSPDDYLLSDESSPHFVKEIMNTASTPLEDPRTQSKKYIVKTVDNNAALTTVAGRNVDLKMVDLSKWGINQVDPPKVLTRRPSQCSDEMISEIYMDIENPISNMSAESGELLSCTEEDTTKADINRKDPVRPRRHGLDVVNKESNNLPVVVKNQINDNLLKSTYRIPKLNKNCGQEKVSQSQLPKQLDDMKQSSKKESFTGDAKRKCSVTKNKAESIVSKSLQGNKNKISQKTHKQEHKAKDSSVVAKEIIAGDLELSDETSDNTDMPGKTAVVTEDKITQITDLKDRAVDNKTKSAVDQSKSEHSSLDKVLEIQQTIKKRDDPAQEQNKKQRSKKKPPKAKEDTDKCEQAPDKQEKLKRNKKTKFTELFGDSNSLMASEDMTSNSLISPKDLGIISTTPSQPPSNQYVPICEDAQDAVDVSEIAKIRTRVSEMPKTNDVKEVEPQAKTSETKETKSKDDKTKLKNHRNSQTAVSNPVDQPSNEPCQKLSTNIPTKEESVIIPPVETKPDPVPAVVATDLITQEACEIPKNKILNKPDVMIALATSTPQKFPQQDSTDVAETSADTAAAAPAPDAVVPDVRIFVKRRRRVIKKSS